MITIFEFADVIGKTLEVRRIPNFIGGANCWLVHFESSETKKDSSDSILSGSSGRGKTPNEAIDDYEKNIVGKLLVFNAGSKELRKEFNVPAMFETTGL